MKIKLTTIVFIAIILSTVTSVLVYLFLQNITLPGQLYETTTIPMKIQVADYIGFDLNTTELNFGAVLPGGHSRRNITIINTYDTSVEVIIKLNGDMKDWVYGYKDRFTLQKGASTEMMLTVTLPTGIGKGTYEGTAYISFYKEK
jgi:hypothetical protein